MNACEAQFEELGGKWLLSSKLCSGSRSGGQVKAENCPALLQEAATVVRAKYTTRHSTIVSRHSTIPSPLTMMSYEIFYTTSFVVAFSGAYSFC